MMIEEAIQKRLELHQKRVDHIDYLMSEYGQDRWPGGGQKKFEKDFYERMVLKGIVKELKHILELKK